MQARSPSSSVTLFDVLPRLGDDLFDARRVDAPVEDQLGQRDAGDFAPDRVEAGEDDGVGRVVDDQVYAGGALQRADVAALAPDDAALHLVVGQRHDRDGDIRDLVGGAALDGQRDDLARSGLSLLARDGLDLAGAQRGGAVSVLFDSGDQLGARLIGGHARHALQLGHALLAQRLQAVADGVQLLGALVDGALAPLDALALALQRLLFGLLALLLALDLLAPLARL